MSARIGFYICHCGINIAYRVRVEEVAAFARQLDNVVVSRDYKFMCSDPGQEMIEKDIQEYGLNRVVVASCSPRLHEKTFQGACQRAGLNPYYFQMASVREQVSWVTADEDEATRKAKTLAAAAINRVNFHDHLETREVDVHPDILVVGGGIAGMQAALDIGASGHKTYLVEKDTTIGGHMLQFDKTFPTLDCAACIGTPKMVSVAQEKNIQLFSYSEVKEVSGYIGNYTVTIYKKPRYVKEGVCTGCGECTKACPVTVSSEWDVGIGDRKAIYRAFPQAVPITFCIDKKDRAPCVTACPAGINVQGYVQLIKQGKFKESVQLIQQRLPLPGVLGRVCPHPCETQCRRKEIDSAVSIRNLKRFVADQVDLEELETPAIEDRPEKVAVIGSGPAGLTVAYYLRLKGFQITLFESLEKLGGMLRVGIPDYRLPPEILDREIGYVLNTGIEVKTQTRLGADFTLKDLETQGFQAVFIGVGAHASMSLNIPGEDLSEGVVDAVQFLRRVNLGDRNLPGKRVTVIGGGNVAIDAARVAKRLGAETVTVVYRRSEQEMPAYAEEIEGAKEEGIDFCFLTAPVRIHGEAEKVTGLECIRTELGPPDESGRRRPVPVEGSEHVIPCDAVLPAIGQRTDMSWAEKEPDLKWSRYRTLEVNPETMQTSIPHVFAAGDAVSGPATVIEAVGAGHRAVAAIQRFLDGENLGAAVEAADVASSGAAPEWRDIPETYHPARRAVPPQKAPEERLSTFDEVEAAFSGEEAVQEAERCLNCGVCCECMECVNACEANAIDHQMKGEEVQVKVGSIILATGFDLMDPSPMTQFGYKKYPNVYTGLEFERLSNATGPTGGQILIRDENGDFTRKPQSVAICHCIGSRDVNYHEYCSRVCCMYALKYTHLIKEKVGHDTRVYDFYIDQRCFGKGYEEFFRRCQEEGTVFIRGKVSDITDEALDPEEAGKLIAVAEDTLLGRRLRVPVDMVILCSAMEARKDAVDVGRIFGVNQGADGFFLEEHPKLGPLNTATDGVFIAGTCQGPKDIPDTVAQASGAAAKALSLATRGKVEVPSTISWIDPDICIGCQMCIGLCAYSAIEFDERRGVSVVNEAVCKGCGSCSGFCPSGAAQVRHFKKKQIFAELDGIMDALDAVGM
ncbi:MAG: FAD-dependent oxidoreductase [Deltaproteobacteria bacterium]|nr:FAD-dependent oxidoreductase [Deltaproteobacteria bacterium]MBW2041344.1 FAD-dependent oxidoreductase [Deltaproteobacteria bacterium]MBW2131498.1 FAD-dependent oxidoreductase [Deltaproteobacteria bacterium]